MLNYLSIDAVSKSFNDKVLFKNLTFGINQGEKAALVGINGCGKSTILKMIAGETGIESGNISVRKGIKIGYLDQQPYLSEEFTVWQAMFETENPLLQAIREYEAAYLHADEQPERFMKATEDMDYHQAWETETKIRQILGRLDIHDTEKLVSTLSGGQRKRIALAKLLLSKPDLMILDEPTNHLDLETIEWLENLLTTDNQTLLIVTHDRYFLDKITNVIFELDNGQLYRYNGNYGYFLEKKQERMDSKQAEVEKARNLMRKEYEWIKRQPKARGTKAKYRVDAFEDLKEKASQKVGESGISINVGMNRTGSKILEIKNVSKNYGDLKILYKFDYVFKKQDRIGVVGKNGIGKTTFLNMLTGKIEPDKGSLARGDNTQIGYYTQTELKLDADKRVIDAVRDIAEYITTGTGTTISASQLLTHFEFPPATQYNLVTKLSGGEKRRLQLLQVLITNPNFLILDEPTNDLDIKTLNILEDYLLGYKGVLVLVSHDRYFMDRLVDHLFVFEGEGEVRDFGGNYTDYRETKLEEEQQKQQNNSKTASSVSQNNSKPAEKPKNNNKIGFKEKQEYERLEKEIAVLEEKKQALTEKMGKGEGSYQDFADWNKEMEALSSEIDSKTFRWLELAEMV